MSMLFGGGGVGVKPTLVHHVRVSDSQYGIVLPVGYGRMRVAGHLIWLGDFAAKKNSGPGKGLAGGSGSGVFYTYSASMAIMLMTGPITGVGRRYSANVGGLTRFPASEVAENWHEFLGTLGQAPWSYLTSNHPGQDLGYTGMAYVAQAHRFLGTSAVLPQETWEVFAALPFSTTIKDADASAVIQDIISNSVIGMVPSASWLDATTFADLTKYITAYGFFISPYFDQQKAGREWLTLLFELIHADAVWSEGQLRAIPYAVDAVTGNGVTWTPNIVPIADFDDDDFVLQSPSDHGLTIKIVDPSLRNNIVTVEFINTLNDYNIEPVEQSDESDVVVLGRRRASPKQYHPIPTAGMAAQVAKLKLQQEMAITRTYTFKAAPTIAALLDPMDVISITSRFHGLTNYAVRIVSINESGDTENGTSNLEIEVICEDLAPSLIAGLGLGGGAGGGTTGGGGQTGVYFRIGFTFTSSSVGIYRNTDFTATVFTNVDPSDWNPLTDFYQDLNMDVDGKTVVAAGNLISYSTDGGATFHPTNVNDASLNTLIGESTQHSIAFSPTRAVCVGEYDAFGSGSIGAAWWADRTNLAVWTRVQINNITGANDSACFGLAWGPVGFNTVGAFVAAFRGGLQTSLDGGQTWTRTFDNVTHGIPVGTAWNIVEHNGSYFLAVASAGPTTTSTWMATSPDGQTWTLFVAAVNPNVAFTLGTSVSGNYLAWDSTRNCWLYELPFPNSPNSTLAGIWTSDSTGQIWTSRYVSPTNIEAYAGLCPVGTEWFMFGGTTLGQTPFISNGTPVMVRASDPTGVWTRTTPVNVGSGEGWGLAGVGIMVNNNPTVAVSVDDGATWTDKTPPAPFFGPSGSAGFYTSWAFAFGGAGFLLPPPTQPPGGGPAPDPFATPASVNPPIFVEPHTLVSTPHTLWIALSGQFGNLDWGGANVWMSVDAGASYVKIGQAVAPATMGVLLAGLPATPDPDTIDSLVVDLSESAGVVIPIAHAQADAGYNLAIIDNEYINFGDVAALSGPNQYNLTYLRRGRNGSTDAAHSQGANFFYLGSLYQLDSGVTAVTYPAADVGVQLWFKFTSFNLAGSAEESLANVTAYPYTPVGP